MKTLLLVLLALIATPARAAALETVGTFCSTFPLECSRGTVSELVARGIGTDDFYVLEVDPTTGEIPVQISTGVALASEGPIADPVPTYGIQMAGKDDNGDLTAVHVDTSGDVQVDVLSSALPSGAATSAKQPALGTAGTASADVITVQGIASMTPLQIADNGDSLTVDGTVAASNLPATVDTNVGAAGASTLRTVAAGNPISNAIVASNAYASTNVTTAAYVELIASTANAINTLCLSDSSGSIIKVATGAAASEVDRIYLPGGGSGCFQVNIAASTRVSLRAIDASATSGYFLLTAY